MSNLLLKVLVSLAVTIQFNRVTNTIHKYSNQSPTALSFSILWHRLLRITIMMIINNDNDKQLGLTAKADQPDHKKYSTLKVKIFAYILQVGPSLPLPPLRS